MSSNLVIDFIIRPNPQQTLLPVAEPIFTAPLIFGMQAPSFTEFDCVECLQPVDIIPVIHPVILCIPGNRHRQE
jgi:hypothetical protein